MLREQIYLQRLILIPLLSAIALAQETASLPESAQRARTRKEKVARLHFGETQQ
jgi:hypothetical protein